MHKTAAMEVSLSTVLTQMQSTVAVQVAAVLLINKCTAIYLQSDYA